MAEGTKGGAKKKSGKTAREHAAENPLAVLAGGLAIGAALGALIPRLAKEREALAPVGKKLAERAGSAVKAAREAGKAEIDALLPARDQARDKVGQLVTTVIEAAKGAAQKKG